jgi:endoglucanase
MSEKEKPVSYPVLEKADLEEDFLLLKQLADTAACTGFEEPITAKLYDLAKNLCDDVHIDALGSVIATIKGDPGDYTILVDTHCDEIGFQVVYIEDNGFVRVAAVGGQNPRILPGARVKLHGHDPKDPNTRLDLVGVIGEKPIHHLSAEDRKKSTEIHQLFIDIGLNSKKDVQQYLKIGDFATLDQEATRFHGSTMVTGKAFDDRAGCWVALYMLRALKQRPRIRPNVTVVFAAQEEIGVRGATAAAFRVNPDLAIVLEVGHAMDYPGAKKSEVGEIVIGKGPMIPIGPNVFPKISRRLLEVAERSQIPVQPIALPDLARNDARTIQITRQGIPTGLITVPLRYMHTTIETIDLRDLHHAGELLLKFIESDPFVPKF